MRNEARDRVPFTERGCVLRSAATRNQPQQARMEPARLIVPHRLRLVGGLTQSRSVQMAASPHPPLITPVTGRIPSLALARWFPAKYLSRPTGRSTVEAWNGSSMNQNIFLELPDQQWLLQKSRPKHRSGRPQPSGHPIAILETAWFFLRRPLRVTRANGRDKRD
jgi:hypothetical protein